MHRCENRIFLNVAEMCIVSSKYEEEQTLRIDSPMDNTLYIYIKGI